MPPVAAARPKVSVASTGPAPELVETLPIAAASAPRVVMSMGQGGAAHASLPDLRPGDRLLVSAELEVTTDCHRQQTDCVGKPYVYAPTVETTLLLASSAGQATQEAGRSLVVGQPQRRAVPHARHHDVLVFDNAEFVVPRSLGWSGPTFLNLAASALHPKATRGHVLIVGQHEPGGTVKGDMSGLSVVRLRPGTQPLPKALRTTTRSSTTVPVVTGQRAVAYSLRLDQLRKGEQLRVRARVKPSSAHLTYPVRVTTELLLTDSPTSTEPGREARRTTPESPQICRGNGFNCLKSESPATSTKAGAMQIAADAQVPLYVNAVVIVGDPLDKAAPGDTLSIIDGGMIEVVRFPAAAAG
jgi:hypothetical protein